MLGLKPLKVEGSDSRAASGASGSAAAAENGQEALGRTWTEVEVELERRRKEEELQRRIGLARKQRQLRERVGGESLAEKLRREAGMGNAADWVQRSRQREAQGARERELEEARRRAQALEELDGQLEYTPEQLAGLAVAHGLTDLPEGEAVVLTLADTRLLDEKGEALVEGADQLENVELAEQARARERAEEARRAKQPVYAGYDDYEFEELGGIGPGASVSDRLLPQYNEQRKKKPALVLGGGGSGADAGATRGARDPLAAVAAIRAKLAGKAAAGPQSLHTEKRAMADTAAREEEPVQFQKPKRAKKLRKRPRAEGEGAGEGGAEGGAEGDAPPAATGASGGGLARQLQPLPGGDDSVRAPRCCSHPPRCCCSRPPRAQDDSDRRTRGQRAARGTAPSASARRQAAQAAFDAAVAKANAQSERLRGTGEAAMEVDAQAEGASAAAPAPAPAAAAPAPAAAPGAAAQRFQRPSARAPVRLSVDDLAADDDTDLQASLERVRRMALKARQPAAPSDAVAAARAGQEVAARMADARRRDKEHEAAATKAALFGDDEGKRNLVFTGTTEFSMRLQARMDKITDTHAARASENAVVAAEATAERNRARAAREVAEQEEAEGGAAEVDADEEVVEAQAGAEPRENGGQWVSVDERERKRAAARKGGVAADAAGGSRAAANGGEDSEENEDVAGITREPLVARGMGAALALLGQKASLCLAQAASLLPPLPLTPVARCAGRAGAHRAVGRAEQGWPHRLRPPGGPREARVSVRALRAVRCV